MLQGKPSVFPLGSLERNTPRLYPALLPNQGIIFQTASSSLFFRRKCCFGFPLQFGEGKWRRVHYFVIWEEGEEQCCIRRPLFSDSEESPSLSRDEKTTHQSSWQIKEGANESVNRLIIQRNLILTTIPPNERNLQAKSAKKKTSKQEDDQHFIRKLL